MNTTLHISIETIIFTSNGNFHPVFVMQYNGTLRSKMGTNIPQTCSISYNQEYSHQARLITKIKIWDIWVLTRN